MSIALESFYCIFQFIMSQQVELSTYIGMSSCGCTIFSNVVLTNISYLTLIKRAAHSASEVDAITFLIICDMVKIVPLLSFLLNVFVPLKETPPRSDTGLRL